MIMSDHTAPTRDIVINGIVDDRLADALLRELQSGNYDRETHLRLFLNSSGGSIPIAMAIARILLSSFNCISTYNLSTVDSAAIIIYLAGAQRYSCSTARFLFHAPEIQLNGSYNQRALTEYMTVLQSDSESALRYMHERTEIPLRTLGAFMQEQHICDCEQALNLGLATGRCDEPQTNEPCYLRTTC